jgi:nucleotide-binding universal stress UspA family protein
VLSFEPRELDVFGDNENGGEEMIPVIKKILYATDLSENARHAFAYAASLANRYDAGITVIHVLEDISAFSDSLVISVIGEQKWNELWDQKKDAVISTIKSRLESFCEEVQSELPACPFITDDVVVKIGNPVEEILHQVDITEADLVVMGSRGQGFLTGAMMGSTSRRVLRRCKKPVLIIRSPE